jgi:predicted TIM-barrel fold metal-dependent hydrolase
MAVGGQKGSVMKKTCPVLMLMLSCALILGVAGCGSEASSSAVAVQTTSPTSLSTGQVALTPAGITTSTSVPGPAAASDSAATSSSASSYWIDAHAHLDPGTSADGLSGVDLLVSRMDEAGIDKVVLWNLRGGISVSTDVAEAYGRYPDRIIPFRGDDGLDVNDPASLDLIAADLDTGIFRGLGEIVTRHGNSKTYIPVDHPVMLGLFELAAQHGIPVSVHMDTTNPSRGESADEAQWLARFERALDQCSSTTFIWAHCGIGPSPDVVRRMLDRHPNLYCDLSARNPVWAHMRQVSPELLSIDRPEWIDLLNAYPSRFLFGTDAYGDITYVGYPDIVAWFEEHIVPQLSREAAEAITRGNAERLILFPAETEQTRVSVP